MNLKALPQKHLALALIIFACGSIYAWHLNNPLLAYDDKAFIETSIPVAEKNLLQYLRSYTVGHFYPVTALSYYTDYLMCGKQGTCFHLSNLILHTINSCLFFILLSIFLKFSNTTSLIISLVFATHPALSEVVYWMAARGHAMALMFSFLTLFCFLTYREKTKNKEQGFVAIRLYMGTLFLFTLALLSNENALALLPLLLLLWPWKRNVLVGVFKILPFVLVSSGFIYILFLASRLAGPAYNDFVTMDYTTRFLYSMKSLVFYFSKSLVSPISIVFYDVKNFSLSAFQIIVVFLWIPILYVASRKNLKLCLIVLLWFFAVMLPVLKWIPFGENSLVNDRYLYMSLPALLVIVAITLNKLSWVLFPLIFLHAGLSFGMGYVWQSDVHLWKHVLKYDEKAAIAHTMLAVADFKSQNLDEAQSRFKFAHELRPEYLPALLNLSNIERMQKNYTEALRLAQKAKELNPWLPQVHEILGYALLELREIDKAIESFEECRVMAGYNRNCINALYRLYIYKKDCSQAKFYMGLVGATHPDCP